MTDRKDAETTLRRQNRLLAKEVRDRTRKRNQMWHLSHDLMIVCDLVTRPVAVNPTWIELLGWTEAELIGRRAIELVHPEDGHNLRRGSASAANDTVRLEARMKRKDGGDCWIAWTGVSHNTLV